MFYRCGCKKVSSVAQLMKLEINERKIGFSEYHKPELITFELYCNSIGYTIFNFTGLTPEWNAVFFYWSHNKLWFYRSQRDNSCLKKWQMVMKHHYHSCCLQSRLLTHRVGFWTDRSLPDCGKYECLSRRSLSSVSNGLLVSIL